MPLNLPPATLLSPKIICSTITLSGDQATVNRITRMGELKEFANLIGYEKFEGIVTEMLLTAEASGETFKRMHWSLKIDGTLGVLKVIEVKANLNKTGGNLKINLTGVFVEINQVIPPVYRLETGSYKTGPRRYLIMGPRGRVDYCYHVQRGLNPDEVAQVIQALNAKIPKARALIKAKWESLE